MHKKALILHAWYSKPENNWYTWLKGALEKKGYEVTLPELPTMDSDLPDMKKQLEYIQSVCAVGEDTTVIGHSLGCLLAMRLGELRRYKKMFLVAGWDFDDLTREHALFWPNKIDHGKIVENVHTIFCFSSDNDPYVTAYQAEEMSKRFHGKYILLKGKGHFTEKENVIELPELLELCK
jgi:uncharacterized protein